MWEKITDKRVSDGETLWRGTDAEGRTIYDVTPAAT